MELNTAKNAGTHVRFDLATDTSFTDGECSVKGTVILVDKFSIKIEISGTERQVWIAKPMIVGTEVLNV